MQKSEEKSCVHPGIVNYTLRNLCAALYEMLSPAKAGRSNEGAQSAEGERWLYRNSIAIQMGFKRNWNTIQVQRIIVCICSSKSLRRSIRVIARALPYKVVIFCCHICHTKEKIWTNQKGKTAKMRGEKLFYRWCDATNQVVETR